MEKYGIPKFGALTGSEQNLIRGKLRNAIRENENDPETLYEIMEILKTISAYWLDVIFAITNALMLIIDILTAIVAFIDGPFPIADAAAGGIGLLLTFGLIGVEFSAEAAVHGTFDPIKERIQKLAVKNLTEMTGGPSETSAIGEESIDFSGTEYKAVKKLIDLGMKAT